MLTKVRALHHHVKSFALPIILLLSIFVLAKNHMITTGEFKIVGLVLTAAIGLHDWRSKDVGFAAGAMTIVFWLGITFYMPYHVARYPLTGAVVFTSVLLLLFRRAAALGRGRSLREPITVAVEEFVPTYDGEEFTGYERQTRHYVAVWDAEAEAFGYRDFERQLHWVSFPWTGSW